MLLHGQGTGTWVSPALAEPSRYLCHPQMIELGLQLLIVQKRIEGHPDPRHAIPAGDVSTAHAFARMRAWWLLWLVIISIIIISL